MNNKQQNIDNMKDAFNSIDGTEVNSSYNDNELTLEEVEIFIAILILGKMVYHSKKRLRTLKDQSVQ